MNFRAVKKRKNACMHRTSKKERREKERERGWEWNKGGVHRVRNVISPFFVCIAQRVRETIDKNR